MIMITPAEFEDKMKAIAERHDDVDVAHVAADELMCKALIDNGYEAGVKIFDSMTKWYG